MCVFVYACVGVCLLKDKETIETYRIADSPKKGKVVHADRVWLIQALQDGMHPFALGYVKGTTRIAAAFMICMAAIELGIDLTSVNPTLVTQLQSIHINLHVATDPSKLFMKSMTVSHDNVRQKPHVFYWIRAVPKQ